MDGDDDAVFKAIADPTTRAMLDALRLQPGMTSGQLCDQHPQMTRYGVSAHMRVLEGAGLVTVTRDGRYKRHYLNAVPLQEIRDSVTRLIGSVLLEQHEEWQYGERRYLSDISMRRLAHTLHQDHQPTAITA